MSHQLTTSRAARNRRLIAVTAWAALIVTAMILWNGRTQGILHRIGSEPAAFLLAAFTAFISLFAWMLYNPARGVSAETPMLMLAGAATLFTPCVIGFCIMPPDSPLRGWLVVGLFLLLAIAVMSPVPDEFFAIPRERHTYVQPMPFLNISNRSVLDDNPNWFHTSDLSRVVETDLPSLAPNAWRYRDRPLPASERRSYSDSDIDLEEALFDDDLSGSRSRTIASTSSTKRPRKRGSNRRSSRTVQRDSERHESVPGESLRRAETRHPRRPASIWFRPRPVAYSSDPPSVPFGPPAPLSLLRGQADLPASFRTDLPLRVPAEQPPESQEYKARTQEARSYQSHTRLEPQGPSLDIEPPEESRPASGTARAASAVRGAASGIRGKAAGIAGAAAGLAGAAAAAIPSAFRSRAADVETPDQLVSDADSRSDPFETQRDDRRAIRPERNEQASVGDTIQVADHRQQKKFERTRDEYGGELLEGAMTVHFDRGQKKANLHIPFSPPMSGIPEVECEAIGGESLRLKVPERRSYGIRIEARRSDADEEMDTEIGFAAVCVAAQ